jgi:hypothetical protein
VKFPHPPDRPQPVLIQYELGPLELSCLVCAAPTGTGVPHQASSLGRTYPRDDSPRRAPLAVIGRTRISQCHDSPSSARGLGVASDETLRTFGTSAACRGLLEQRNSRQLGPERRGAGSSRARASRAADARRQRLEAKLGQLAAAAVVHSTVFKLARLGADTAFGRPCVRDSGRDASRKAAVPTVIPGGRPHPRSSAVPRDANRPRARQL